jgi:hypothetical protein
MNRVYKDLLFNLAKRAVQDANSISGLLHSGLKGQLRELFVRELLIPTMPREYVVGSGNILSAYEDISPQLDVVICDGRILPPILFQSDLGMFPIESALVTIEIKSRLDADELKSSHASAERVAKFRHAPSVGNKPMHDPIEHVVPYLFAFSSDLAANGKTEIERYTEITSGGEPVLRGMCVVGRGFWFWSDSKWHTWKFSGEHAEIVEFLTAIINTVQRVAATRSQPDLRSYLCD